MIVKRWYKLQNVFIKICLIMKTNLDLILISILKKKFCPIDLITNNIRGDKVSLLDANESRDTVVGISQLVKFNAIKRKREQSVLHV